MVDGMTSVEVGEGCLEVEVMGRGEPVLVVQTALTADELRPVSQQIARSGDYQVFHCHRRGYAGSSPIRRQGSVRADATDAGALIRAMDAGPLHLVGVSYSAAVALSLACWAPELVQTLTVVEPPPVGTPSAAEFRRANRELLGIDERFGSRAALDHFMTTLVGGEWRAASERESPGSVGAMERDAPTFFGSDIPALLSWGFDATDAARIGCPVLCVGGSESGSWFVEMREEVVRLLPHPEEATVEGAGHLVASTHPAELAALLLDHFRRHPRPDVPRE